MAVSGERSLWQAAFGLRSFRLWVHGAIVCRSDFLGEVLGAESVFLLDCYTDCDWHILHDYRRVWIVLYRIQVKISVDCLWFVFAWIDIFLDFIAWFYDWNCIWMNDAWAVLCIWQLWNILHQLRIMILHLELVQPLRTRRHVRWVNVRPTSKVIGSCCILKAEVFPTIYWPHLIVGRRRFCMTLFILLILIFICILVLFSSFNIPLVLICNWLKWRGNAPFGPHNMISYHRGADGTLDGFSVLIGRVCW